ncbi:glycosyltransferase [Novosphingobium capsulatum]|nr:glycosyltransferase [Novosphingobium capsulatum]
MMSLSTVWLWLAMLQRELLLFAATCLAVGACQERRLDGLWAWLRITGRACTLHLASGFAATADWPARVDRGAGGLPGAAAVLVPVWSEAPVVAAVIEHCLAAWPNADLRLYVGCHRNDPATLAAVMRCATDPRLRIVVHDRDGPTTKADCLNRLYLALQADEARSGRIVRSVIVHDASKPRDDEYGQPPLPALWA